MLNWNEPKQIEFYVRAGRLTSYATDIANYLKCAVPQTNHVMDIGCGPGIIIRLIAEHFDHITAVDPSEAALDYIAANIRGNHLELCLTSLEELPSKCCDTALAISFGRTPQQLELIMKTARKQAILVCSVKSAVLPVTKGITSRIETQSDYLARKGIPYKRTDILSEFGQPFRYIEEIKIFRRQHELEEEPFDEWFEKHVVSGEASPLAEKDRALFPYFMKNPKVLQILDIQVE